MGRNVLCPKPDASHAANTIADREAAASHLCPVRRRERRQHFCCFGVIKRITRKEEKKGTAAFSNESFHGDLRGKVWRTSPPCGWPRAA